MSTSLQARLAVLGALCVLLVGCGKNLITAENYDKIQVGMTRSEVEGLLKKGTEVGDGSMVAGQFGVEVGASRTPTRFTFEWERGNNKITVVFDKQDKVISKNKTGF